jgi:hypothetical protein
LGIFVWNTSGVTQEEIDLAKPDTTEAKSVAIHVRKCALRYAIFTKRQAEQGQNINQIKLLILGVGGYLIIVSDPARNALGFVLKIFGG